MDINPGDFLHPDIDLPDGPDHIDGMLGGGDLHHDPVAGHLIDPLGPHGDLQVDPLGPDDDLLVDPLTPTPEVDVEWTQEDQAKLAEFLDRAEQMGASPEQLALLAEELDPYELDEALASLDWDPVGRSTGLAMYCGTYSEEMIFGGEAQTTPNPGPEPSPGPVDPTPPVDTPPELGGPNEIPTGQEPNEDPEGMGGLTGPEGSDAPSPIELDDPATAGVDPQPGVPQAVSAGISLPTSQAEGSAPLPGAGTPGALVASASFAPPAAPIGLESPAVPEPSEPTIAGPGGQEAPGGIELPVTEGLETSSMATPFEPGTAQGEGLSDDGGLLGQAATGLVGGATAGGIVAAANKAKARQARRDGEEF